VKATKVLSLFEAGNSTADSIRNATDRDEASALVIGAFSGILTYPPDRVNTIEKKMDMMKEIMAAFKEKYPF